MTTTPTSGGADLPDAMRRSTAADGKTELFNLPGYPLMVRAVDFNRIHAESEMRRAALLDEMQKAALAAGQAIAAPAQPAAQQPHRSGCTAGTDEECVQRGCGTNCPAVSPRQGVAYAALPTSNYAGRVYEEGFLIGTCPLYTADQLHAFADATHTLRAPHGQAPAGAVLPAGWVSLTITLEGQFSEEVAYGPQIMMDRLGKWLGKYFAQAADSVTAPAPPPECETEAEKRAFAFGWFKALESERMKADNKKKDPL